MAEGAPALPWAAQAASGQDVKPLQDTDAANTIVEEDLQPVDMQQVGLEPGSRIEVMWEVTTDADEANSRWFPASISCSSSSSSAQQATEEQPSGTTASSKQPHQHHRYILRYDGSEEFPEETVTVLLLSEHELYDMERRDAMWWRREGDSFEPPESDAEEDGEGEEGAFLMEDMDVSAEAAGAAESAMMSEVLSLTQSEEHRERLRACMETGYQDFKNQFKAFVAAKASCAGGSNVTITSADVEEFKAMMATQRSTAHRR